MDVLKPQPMEGVAIISFLEETLYELKKKNMAAQVIILGTLTKQKLTNAVQEVMGQRPKEDITINKFRGVLIAEDGQNPERLEIVSASLNTPKPVEGNMLLSGLRRVGT